MPTGYTYAVIEKDLTFKQFALLCARAFGALIDMRDDSMDAPIPEKFEPHDYYLNAMKEAEAKVVQLESMNTDKQRAYGQHEIETERKRLEEGMAKTTSDNSKLSAMIEQVEKWEPPSPDHEGMKTFMLEQLRISLSGVDYYLERLHQLNHSTPLEVFERDLDKARERVVDYQEEWEKEQERTAGRNEWLRLLRESLK